MVRLEQDHFLTEYSKICQLEMNPKDFRGNHLLNTHGLSIESYDKLVESRTELRQVKMASGFTAKRGQCGFCMKVFQSPKHLLGHRRRVHKTTNTQNLERKGVSKASKAYGSKEQSHM